LERISRTWFCRRPDRPGVLVLLDPDRVERSGLPEVVRSISRTDRVEAILLGTSILMSADFCDFVGAVKEDSEVPVILFPGSAQQVCQEADAILFLSLLSGRNPEYLIGEHVKSAPMIKRYGIEAIPTGYLLVGDDSSSAVAVMSNTRPIPGHRTDLVLAHAMAAELLGFRVLYLEAGSGARSPVPGETIAAVRENVSLPLIVGGGLRTKEAVSDAISAGADYVVIGTAFERDSKALEEIL
jgi:putative glycerol-1-phosphate prenyltransferase